MTVAKRYLDALAMAPAEPSLPFLTELIRRHVATFAFASIGPRLGDELPLDADSLIDRIVVRGRGGYCFEQNGLFFEVLQELGFRVRVLLARVIHNQDIHPGLTHRVSLVELDGGRYVADVGFGPLGPPVPVPMPGTPAAADPRGFRIVEPTPGEFHLQSVVDGEPYSLYRFDLVRYGQSDCELGHFYSHRHPDAIFVRTLVASRILDGEVRSLRDRQYWIRRPEGDVQVVITSPEQLRTVLGDDLGVRVSPAEGQRLFDGLPPA